MTNPDFDEIINRIGTHSAKWDALETMYKLDPNESLPMWVADMEFRPPQAVSDALAGMVGHGVFGYYGDQTSYLNSVCGWMQRRHGWKVDPSWVFTTHGLVNGTALAVQTYSNPGDGVILFTPVYHVFARIIAANGRRVVESPLIDVEGRYQMDIPALEASLRGDEKVLIFCSPHNPCGRVWTRQELKDVCDFCLRHDIILVCDEIHHDLVYPGHKHTVMSNVCDDITGNLVMMTAATKTFNMAGGHSGNVIIEDEQLRSRFDATMKAAGMSPNSFGVVMTEAAYNHGDEWLDQLMVYLDGNRKLFDEGVNAIPGIRSMYLEATYLAWVDFSGTGMDVAEFTERVERQARIATNHGPAFGTGGESFLRFNLACPRSVVKEAVDRLKTVFADLQ